MPETAGRYMKRSAAIGYLVLITKCSEGEAAEAIAQAVKHGQVSFRNVAITDNKNGTWTVKTK